MSLIKTTEELKIFCLEAEKYSYVTIDTEFIRDKSYYAKLCLIQVAFPGNGKTDSTIIDPCESSLSLDPFYDLLQKKSVIKVFHAARQDLEIFFTTAGVLPDPLFDTQIAAMVCGFGDQVAYETLVNKILNKHLDKSSRFTDWAIRPLSPSQINYALSDVTHLRKIYEFLNNQIIEGNRVCWLKEELDILKDPKTYLVEPDQAWKKIRLKRKDTDFLKIVKALAIFREKEAQNRDIPRGHIIKDDEILRLASSKPKKIQDLKNSRLLSRSTKTGWIANGIIEALKNTEKIFLEPLNEPHHIPLSAEQEALIDLLRLLLKLKSSSHNVAVKLIASAKDLEMIARHKEPNVRAIEGWRYEVFGKDALRLKNGEISLSFDKNGLCIK